MDKTKILHFDQTILNPFERFYEEKKKIVWKVSVCSMDMEKKGSWKTFEQTTERRAIGEEGGGEGIFFLS